MSSPPPATPAETDATRDPLAFRAALGAGDEAIFRAYKAGTRVSELVKMRVQLVDELLRGAWNAQLPAADELALVAVGGYGRGELHPHSDIDLLLLVPAGDSSAYTGQIERFVTFLWDCNLNIGHSVRNPEQCFAAARDDVTVATNLMETRLLAGRDSLYNDAIAATGPERIWPSPEFLQAKLDEQSHRHAKYHDTAYKLEPNIKESPGGLRDIQMILWVANRHFGAVVLEDLVARGLLTATEYRTLNYGKQFLWKVRYLLHHFTGRCEDRLSFDVQRELAHAFGHLDDTNNLAIEQFMQRYYRTVMQLQRLNDVLLQWFKETLLHSDDEAQRVRLNQRFEIRKGFLDVVDANVFQDYPPALFEVFVLLAQHPEIEDVRARTIRLIRDSVSLINESFRNSPVTRDLFMQIFRADHGITHNLRRMNRYGLLAAYLPVFEKIVGRMQYDLFHAYTVDEHTLFVIRNLRRIGIDKHHHELPFASSLFSEIARPDVLYLAGLFHDIAKGRAGDHSELGAVDAREFCEQHRVDPADTELVVWLVANHLLMSVTAQRKDLSDPRVIHAFAEAVNSINALNHLYLLTVADIRATNPELWNSWKDNLLQELYRKAVAALHRGLDNPIDALDRIREIKDSARQRLSGSDIDTHSIDNIWQDFGDDYFLRHSPDEVAWHTEVMLSRHVVGQPVVAIRSETERGSTEVLVFVADHDHLFALVSTVLDRLGTDIVDARIVTSESGWAVDTFLILENDGDLITDPLRLAEIQRSLETALRSPEHLPPLAQRLLPRKLRHFEVPVTIHRTDEQRDDVTPIQIIAGDRPGLLARIGRAFVACDLRVHSARITTVGERAEDVFFVTDNNNQPLHDDQQLADLRQALVEQLAKQ